MNDFEKIPECVWQLFANIMVADFTTRRMQKAGLFEKWDAPHGDALTYAWGWDLLEFGSERHLTKDGLMAWQWYGDQLKERFFDHDEYRDGEKWVTVGYCRERYDIDGPYLSQPRNELERAAKANRKKHPKGRGYVFRLADIKAIANGRGKSKVSGKR